MSMSLLPAVPSRTIREALSWRLVAELHRRHPGRFTVIETHPGGGLYDCLTLTNEQGVIADINRVGGFTVHSTNHQIPWDEIWPVCVSEAGVAGVLDRLSEACRFAVPSKLPPTNPETLMYRIMAGVSATLVFEKDPWEWRNGQEDTSGEGSQAYRYRWFDAFPAAKSPSHDVTQDLDDGTPKCGFWFLIKNNLPMLCVSRAALCWDLDGGAINLAESYLRDRRVFSLIGVVLDRLR